ncbi:MAG: alpha-L-rhamnosidase-related protein [Candidatus Izemoplasmataceae bacterium]
MEKIEISGKWLFTKDDPSKTAEWEEVIVPHTWNNIDGQDGGNDYYRGLCFYKKELQINNKDKRVYIEFEGANSIAHLYILWMGINLGDWLAPGKDVKWFAINNNPVSNTFIINDFRVISDYAKRNNLEEDYNRYYDFYKKAQAGYIATFINENGMIQGDYQGAYVLALQYVLKDHKIRQTVMNNLVENVKENGLQTGFFATEYLLPLLIEANEPKLAYDILLNESNPGWMYQINHGATSIWERWDAILEDGSVNETVITNDNMVSFNHYAFGSIGRFYYQYILGIQAIEPGYQKIKIRPYIDDRLRAVSGSYESVQGLIEVSWRIIDGAYELNVTVPTSATIILLSGEEHEVIAGTYVFREKYKKENGK